MRYMYVSYMPFIHDFSIGFIYDCSVWVVRQHISGEVAVITACCIDPF